MSDKKEELIVLDTDSAAAEYKTVSGWVSRNGHFWGEDERMARYEGSTHKTCSCGTVHSKSAYCRPCHEKKQLEKYWQLPFKEYDGGMLYDASADRYFTDAEDFWDYAVSEIENNSYEPRLQICRPQHARYFGDDYYCDELPEDQSLEDVAPELAEAMDKVNALIKEKQFILSWLPDKSRTAIRFENDGELISVDKEQVKS